MFVFALDFFERGGGYVNNSFQLDTLSESYPQEIDFVGLCFSLRFKRGGEEERKILC